MNADDATSEGRASARPTVRRSVRAYERRTCGSTSLRDEIEQRKHPIHLPPLERHNLSIIIYVTACTAKRRKVLACPEVHQAIVAAWVQASTWLVGRYVVMPNHVHFFCAPNGFEAPSLERWMRFWKSRVTATIGNPGGGLWQRDHWDRQLRRGQSYDEKWDYVRNNPVRHGYLNDPDDWLYQGELHELRW
jgi:putative transposase